MKNPSPIPTAAGRQPLLGHLLPLLRDPLRFLARLPERGDLVRVRLGPLQALVVCDPGLTSHVLRDERTFDKGGPLSDRLREVTGNGLATCPHAEHRRQRRLIQPAFHPARFPGYAQAITARAAETTESWQDGQVLDVVAEMQGLTARITVDTLFSTTTSPDLLTQTLGDVNAILNAMPVRMMTPPPLDRLPTRSNRRYHRAQARLTRTLFRLVTERRATGTDHGDLLSMLLTARDTDSGPAEEMLSDAEIIDQVVTFFLGGADTSAAALAWALHLLGQHPEIEARLHAEADAVLGGRPATHADLPRLELAGRILTETLRLWPPGWVVTRTCTTDTQLGPHAVSAGTSIVYSPYLLHRRADLFPDPDRFDPDRWTPENPHPPRREAFIPFGVGARKCIGDRFSTTMTVLALATIAARWQLRHLPGARVRPARGIALNPSGLRMHAISRSATGTAVLPNGKQEES
ncbi:cytochrome P450 [Streptomyces capitiformicae]|uniref:cytochrome P450 n=1 Tax=Streptomyces capitiformicae TaxID=2014920 RepID=UPI001E43F4D9|nr:cytochrome P450 [Streptomyces capitiformicae]